VTQLPCGTWDEVFPP